MTDMTALMIAIVSLYSTGHWIGATVLAAWLLWGMVFATLDPLASAIRRYKRHRRTDQTTGEQ